MDSGDEEVMAHREGIREYLADVLVYGKVVDWGAGTKPIQNYLKENTATFFTIDQLEHVEPDLVANIDTPLILDEKYNFAFCLEVLEHVWDSRQLLKNIYDNLEEGGKVFLSQPFMYEVHKEDDRVRFTHHGLKQLFEEVGFKDVFVASTGGEDIDHSWGYIAEGVK